MNILVVNGSADLYGANRILLTVLQKLSVQHNIVLYLPSEGPLTIHIRKSNIRIKVVVRNKMPFIARKLNTISGFLETVNNFRASYFYFKKEVKKHEIDLVYINTLACFPMIKLFQMLDKKILVHVHELLEEPRFVTHIINKYAVKWATRIICVSEPVRQNLLLSMDEKVSADKLTVILNGIDDKLQPVLFKEDDRVIITLIGRITKEKGIWFFLDAISLLPADVISKCEFRIIGGPAPGRENLIDVLRTNISNHVYSKYIVFIPFIEDVIPKLNETDILVVPSLMRDPFPTTILEGLSAGKAVIATNTGGAVQSIQHNLNGILMEAGDNAAFSDNLVTLIKNPTRRNELGKKARESFLDKFQLATFQDKVSDYIQDILNE